MLDDNTPSRTPGLRRLVAIAVTGALTLGLTGTAWALLPPAADEAFWFDRPEPVAYPDDGSGSPAPEPSPVEAAPLSAPEPPPADAPAPAQSGQISEEEATQQTNEALQEAIRLLQASDACKRLIGTSEPEVGPPVFPWDRIEELRRDKRIADTYELAGPDGTPARIGPLDRPGVLPVLQLFKEFHGEPTKELLYKVFGDGEYRTMVDYMFESLGGTITPKEFRALVILHEIAHLTGKLGGHGTPSTAVIGWRFSSDVFTLCTRGNRAPTQPAPRRDDEDLSGGTGFGGGGLTDYGGGFTWPDFPSGDLGSSDDPQGFDTDVTIRGSDGSILEGGETGDPNDPDYPGYPEYPDYDPDGYDPGYGGGYGGGGGSSDIDGCGVWELADCVDRYHVL